MTISLEQLKNAIKDIKNDFYEGNDSHSRSEYRGACESLDMLIRHFEEVTANQLENDNVGSEIIRE